MNPIVVRFLTSVLMRLLTALGGYFIARGWLTEEEVGIIRSPAVEAIVGVLFVVAGTVYGLVRAWIDRRKIVTALAAPAPMTEKELERRIANGMAAPITTPKTDVPKI